MTFPSCESRQPVFLPFSPLMMCAPSWAAQTDVGGGPIELSDMQVLDFGSGVLEDEFDVHYGLLPLETVLIRAYSDNSDGRVLAEIEPKFIVMFESNVEFIRRIEVSSSSFRMAWSISTVGVSAASHRKTPNSLHSRATVPRITQHQRSTRPLTRHGRILITGTLISSRDSSGRLLPRFRLAMILKLYHRFWRRNIDDGWADAMSDESVDFR